MFRADNNEIVASSINKINETLKNFSKSKKLKNMSKYLTHSSNIRAIKKLIFLVLFCC